MTTVETERFRRGWARLSEVDAGAGQRVIESLEDIAPDLGRYIVELGFGDIYSRPSSTCVSDSSSRSQH